MSPGEAGERRSAFVDAAEVLNYPDVFFASALNFAHRFFAALPIFALAAADNTRFSTRVASRLVESPKAFAAA